MVKLFLVAAFALTMGVLTFAAASAPPPPADLVIASVDTVS